MSLFCVESRQQYGYKVDIHLHIHHNSKYRRRHHRRIRRRHYRNRYFRVNGAFAGGEVVLNATNHAAMTIPWYGDLSSLFLFVYSVVALRHQIKISLIDFSLLVIW